MGYLKRVAEKTYRYAYEGPKVNGKRRQITGTFYDVTKQQAEGKLAKLKERVRTGEHIANPDLTLRELFANFMDAKRRTLAVNTYEGYESYFRLYIGPVLGGVKVSTLRQTHLIDAYAVWLEKGVRGEPLSGRTVHHLHDLVRCVLNFGMRRELVTRNVASLIAAEDLPKATKPEPKALDEAEAVRLLAEARNPTRRAKKRGTLSSEPWFCPAVAFSVYTGARRGEVLAVRWQDLNLQAKSVTIRRSLAETKTRGLFFKSPKNGKARTIALPAPLAAILEEHQAKQRVERDLLGKAYKDDGLVFARADGSLVRPWNYGRAVQDLARRAGVQAITCHDLRDSHASILAKHGVGLDVISKRLGHSTIGVTAERYLHVYTDRDTEAASVLNTLCG